MAENVLIARVMYMSGSTEIQYLYNKTGLCNVVFLRFKFERKGSPASLRNRNDCTVTSGTSSQNTGIDRALMNWSRFRKYGLGQRSLVFKWLCNLQEFSLTQNILFITLSDLEQNLIYLSGLRFLISYL